MDEQTYLTLIAMVTGQPVPVEVTNPFDAMIGE